MRYIANTNGYLQQVSFGADIACNNQTCTEYAGEVPQGYKSLEEWYQQEAEKLYRWKIMSGQLTLDSSAAAPADTVYQPFLIQTGTATISFGTSSKTVKVTFPKAYKSVPVVILSQVFDDTNIVVQNYKPTTTGFTAAVSGTFSSTGSRSFQWVAIGQ